MRTRQFVLFFVLMMALMGQAREISISELPDLVRNKNDKVLMAKWDLKTAQAEAEAANFPLDINLALAVFEERAITPFSVTYDNSEVETTTQGTSFGVTKMFSYGLELDASIQSVDYTSDSLVAVADEWNQMATSITLKIPLLKGLGKEANVAEKIKSPLKRKRFSAKLRQTYAEELEKANDHFLQAANTQAGIEFKQSTVKIYENLLSYYKKANQMGQKDKIQFFEVLSTLEKERSLLMKKKFELEKSLIDLKKIIFFNLDEEEVEQVSLEGIEQAIKKTNINEYTIKKNESLAEKKYVYLESKIDRQQAMQNAKPTLDLELSYNSVGFDETSQESLQQALAYDFPESSIAISFSYPLGDNYNEGLRQKSHWEGVKASHTYRKEKYDLNKSLLEVRAEVKKLMAGEEILKKRLVLSERIVGIKQKLYRRGVISILDLEKEIRQLENLKSDASENRFNLLKQYNKANQMAGYYQY